MRTDLTQEMTVALAQTASRPVLLLQIDWPALGGFPARTLRLADRSLNAAGHDWTALVLRWDEESQPGSAETSMQVTVWNGPLDFGNGPERFSDLLQAYPPEAAFAIVYRWFEGEELDGDDLAAILHARMTGPVVHDLRECRFTLTPLSGDLGAAVLGQAVTRNDYPNAPEEVIGRTKPIVIGQVSAAPGLRVRAAAKTRLTSVALPGATQLEVASTDGFSASGALLLNDDVLTYTGTTATQFTGVTGLNEFHYADDEVVEQISDHRFLFSDPQYSIGSIQNVRVGGQPVASADYSVDLTKGEVVFHKPPQRVRSVDTKFLQAQFDSIAPGNTALDAAYAMQPNLRTRYARIHQASRRLKLRQDDALPALGQIGRVLLRVEHFMEERLNADSVDVRLSGVGSVGALSPPGADDAAVTTGSTDITHNHLDTLAFPIDLPQPPIVPTSQADHVVEQIASGTGRKLTLSSGSQFVSVSFPALPAGALRAEYLVNLNVVSGIFGVGTAALLLNGQTVAVWNASRGDFDYTGGFTLHGGSQPASMTLAVSANGGQWTVDLISLKRLVFYPHQTAATQPAQNTVKGGGTVGIADTPALAAQTEKATRTVVDFFDITAQVNSDWNWFSGREVEIEYTGSSDGRTVFVLHTAFEIEYARRRLELTDEVTADVNGIVDDASGTVTGTPGALIERPDHVFVWSLQTILGLNGSAWNAASFQQAGQQFQGAVPAGYGLAGIVQTKIACGDLWRQWMQSSRSHLFWDATGRACLRFRPLHSSQGLEGEAVKSLDDSTLLLDPKTGQPQLRFIRSSSQDFQTRVDVPYDRTWNAAAFEDRYRSLASVQDAAKAAVFGVRQSPRRFALDWCRDPAMAEDLARFHLAETSQPEIRIEYEAALPQLDLEPGDIVTVSTSYFAGLNSTFAQVEQVNPLPRHRRDGFQGVSLMLKLFPVAFLQETSTESAQAAETLDLLLEYLQTFQETPQMVEVLGIQESPGSWSHGLELSEGFRFQQAQFLSESLEADEMFATADVPESVTETVVLNEGAFVSAAGGWGQQRWGLTGWGGREALV